MQFNLIIRNDTHLPEVGREISEKTPDFVDEQTVPLESRTGEIAMQPDSSKLSSVSSEPEKGAPPVLPAQESFQDTLPYADTIRPGTGFAFGRRSEGFLERPVQREPGVNDENLLTLYGQDLQSYEYLRALKEKIEGAWRYPLEAAFQGIDGDLYVDITIAKDGSLSKLEIVRTSGHSSLDEAVIRTIQQLFPYEPLPEAWGKETLTLTGHFVYTRAFTGLR